MKVTQKTSKIGIPLILFGLAFFFAGYIILLVEPIQNRFVTDNLVNGTHIKPSLVLWSILSALDGLLLGLCLYVGFVFSTIGKESAGESFSFKDIRSGDGFGFTIGACVLIMWVITIVWRAGI